MNPTLEQFLSAELARLGAPSWRVLEGPQGPRIRIGGEWKVSLCSNNYLGLADHPALKEAAIRAIQAYGAGTAAARSLSGSTPVHEDLEEELADFKGVEAALLFNSGNTANAGVIPALVAWLTSLARRDRAAWRIVWLTLLAVIFARFAFELLTGATPRRPPPRPAWPSSPSPT